MIFSFNFNKEFKFVLKDNMGLRTKNFDIFGVIEKSDLKWEGSRQANIEEGIAWKGRAKTVCRITWGGLGRKRGAVFLRGGWYLNTHYSTVRAQRVDEKNASFV